MQSAGIEESIEFEQVGIVPVVIHALKLADDLELGMVAIHLQAALDLLLSQSSPD